MKGIYIRFKNLGSILKSACKKWYLHDPFRESTIIAYSAIFSLPGLLVLVITLAGYFFGNDVVSGHLNSQISKSMGKETASQIQEMILMAYKSKNSLFATIMGLIIILIGATGVFVELQKSFNIIWEIKPVKLKSGFWSFIKARLFSFGLICSISFLLLISLVISSLVAMVGSWIETHWSGAFIVLFYSINIILTLGVITTLFAMMFKILPDVEVKLNSVWIGAFLTALLFVAGQSILGLYFGKADPGSGYGAAGSVVLILLWTSYTAMIVFFGAEFTKAYSDFYHKEVQDPDFVIKEKKTNAK